MISNSCLLALMMVTIWCTYDAAGRSWVKMKKYQRSMREAESRGARLHYKRSGSRSRNWRQRYGILHTKMFCDFFFMFSALHFTQREYKIDKIIPPFLNFARISFTTFSLHFYQCNCKWYKTLKTQERQETHQFFISILFCIFYCFDDKRKRKS